MSKPSPRELFELFYPDPKPPGMFGLYTRTLRRNNFYCCWCHHLPQADRHCRRFRNTRQVRFSAVLHSEGMALQIARERRGVARSSNIQGCAASATALPAFWVIIPYGPTPGALVPLPPARTDALGLLEALDQRASIIISTRNGTQPATPAEGGVIYAFYLLDRPWLFDLEHPAGAERAAATALLGRLQGAVARLAAERGWTLGDVATDLAASFPVPEFPTGLDARGPRAELEVFPVLSGDARYRRGDFESLPEAPSADAQPWRSVLVQPASNSLQRRTFDFAPIADGCSWIRDCRARRARLSQKHLINAARLVNWCEAPGADSRELAHELFRGHSGYTEEAVDQLLARELRNAENPITCAEAGEQLGVVERHCSKCTHFGLIESPVEIAALAAAAANDEAQAPTAEVEPAERPASIEAKARTASMPRTRIVITSDRHEVNDQALAVIAAHAMLFERNGTLLELLRYSAGATAVRRVNEARLEELLSRHCEFVTEPNGTSAQPRRVPPPRWTTRAILARGHWPELRQLSHLTTAPSTHPQTQEEASMIIDDLWDSHGPSRADLKTLERIERHRRAFERAQYSGEHQTSVRNRLLSLLNDMEETVCEEGHTASSLGEAWQRVDELEALFWLCEETPGESSRPHKHIAPGPEPVAAAPVHLLVTESGGDRTALKSRENSASDQPMPQRKAA